MAVVATFTDSEISGLSIELSDREIYNDIRSQIDVTDQEGESADGTPTERERSWAQGYVHGMAPGYSTDITVEAQTGHVNVVWLVPFVLAVSLTDWNIQAPIASYDNIQLLLLNFSGSTCTVRVTNNYSDKVDVAFHVSYEYTRQLALQGAITVETYVRTLTVRATDDTSIAKYGRRVMNLIWPLGQTVEQMQSLVDAYCAKYSEPVVTARMIVTGDEDAKVAQIMARKISDYINVQNTETELNDDFYINNVDITHDVRGMIEAVYELEQARAMEESELFILGTSELDGSAILAW